MSEYRRKLEIELRRAKIELLDLQKEALEDEIRDLEQSSHEMS